MFWNLTKPLGADTPVYPGDPVFQKQEIRTVDQDGYALSVLSMGSHTGTHIDAPRHFFANGTAVDQIAPERFCGEAVLYRAKGPVDAAFFEERPLAGRILLDIPAPYGLTEDAAWHLMMSGIELVAVSGLDIENEGQSGAPVHQILLRAGILIGEGFALTDVPEGPGKVYCLPLPIEGGDGARACALWERDETEMA